MMIKDSSDDLIRLIFVKVSILYRDTEDKQINKSDVSVCVLLAVSDRIEW